MGNNRPRILKPGNDPDCVHCESIDGDLIGTCRWCGQVRAYGSTEFRTDGDIISERSMAQTAASAKGGRGNKGKPSPKKGLPANAGLARDRTPGRPQPTTLPVLVKERDF